MRAALGQPKWRVVGELGWPAVDWRDCRCLYLHTGAIEPVRSLVDGAVVPAYLLGAEPKLVDALFGWAEAARSATQLWYGPRVLELEAYRELTDASGPSAEHGRAVAHGIEEATGRPTFYYLERFYRRGGEDDKRCSACRVRMTSSPVEGEGDSGLRALWCYECRLLTDLGELDDPSDPDAAVR